MLNRAYLEVAEDGQEDARAGEREVIANCIDQMRLSDDNPGDNIGRIKTINYVTRVWNYLLNDLASGENHSSDEFKATLISIGIFIMKHTDKMRRDPEIPFKPVKEISEIILAGMK